MAKCNIIFVVLTKRTRAAAAAGVKKFVTVMVDSGPETVPFFHHVTQAQNEGTSYLATIGFGHTG